MFCQRVGGLVVVLALLSMADFVSIKIMFMCNSSEKAFVQPSQNILLPLCCTIVTRLNIRRTTIGKRWYKLFLYPPNAWILGNKIAPGTMEWTTWLTFNRFFMLVVRLQLSQDTFDRSLLARVVLHCCRISWTGNRTGDVGVIVIGMGYYSITNVSHEKACK